MAICPGLIKEKKEESQNLPELFPVEEHFAESLLLVDEEAVEADGGMCHLAGGLAQTHAQLCIHHKHHLVRQAAVLATAAQVVLDNIFLFLRTCFAQVQRLKLTKTSATLMVTNGHISVLAAAKVIFNLHHHHNLPHSNPPPETDNIKLLR